MTLLITLFLGCLTLVAISLQRTYGHVPERELKRRARAGDVMAKGLYKAAAYGATLRTLLWILIILLSASFFVYTSSHLSGFFALILCGFVIWFGFLWLPAQEATKASVWVATKLAPGFAWILQWLHPIFSRLVRLMYTVRNVHVHTGIYDKDDLLLLFERQEIQADNRIDQTALEIAKHALTFVDKRVEDILTPHRVVKSVNAEDLVGPVLMTELHESGFSRFPVYSGKPDNTVGVLYLRDLLGAKTGGAIKTIMNKQVCYVHEDQSLHDALQAILKTHQQLFIVVNNFEEYVGIVTMEDILEEIVGKQIVDEFDQYDDMRAVANIYAQKEHKQNEAQEAETTTEEPTEVVE